MVWLTLIFMTATALAAIVWPFAFGGGIAPSGGDVAVCKDRPKEIGRDRDAGLIGTADAEATPPVASRRKNIRRLAVFATAIVFLPTVAGGMHLRLGSPDGALVEKIADQRASPSDDALIEAMVAQVESYLKDKPNDGHGWEALAPVYMQLSRYEDAVRAWQNAIANLGASADREENLGEALVAAADGVVTDEARRAFDQALSLDHNGVAARFYLGLAAKQGGRRDEAARIWRDLMAAAPPDADWIATIRDALARLDEPSVAAADNASPSEHDDATMQATVDGLAERLRDKGGDVDSWLMLVRSYETLGERDQAVTATAQARLALASDPEKLSHFDQALRATDKAPGATATPETLESPTTQEPPVADTSSAEQQIAMIKAMVDRLAERLKRDGHDVDGWLQLMRSYVVLGQGDQASAAGQSARIALGNDAEALRRLNAGAKELGVDLP